MPMTEPEHPGSITLGSKLGFQSLCGFDDVTVCVSARSGSGKEHCDVTKRVELH